MKGLLLVKNKALLSGRFGYRFFRPLVSDSRQIRDVIHAIHRLIIAYAQVADSLLQIEDMVLMYNKVRN